MKHEKYKFFNLRYLPLLCVVVAIVAMSAYFFTRYIHIANENRLTSVAETSLKNIIDVGELSTVEYIYNSIATVKNEKGNPKYYVSYEGIVKAGFDFNEITTMRDTENKKIVITIPPIKINSVNIKDDTLDFIFVKDKYDTETTFQEAYKASYADLENKAQTNSSIRQTAYENAVDIMRAIVIPLQSKLPNGYSFDFREDGQYYE